MPTVSSVAAEAAFIGGVVFYAASAVLLFLQMARGLGGAAAKAGPWLLGGGAVGHAAYVTIASAVVGVCPIQSVHFALSVAALVAAGAYFVARLRFRIDVVGAFIAPIGLAFLIGTRMVNLGRVDERLPAFYLTFHVGVNLIGEGLFLLASVTALLYLFVETRLKQKRPSALFGRLPPLDALDKAEHRFLLFGFPLLTLGIITGTAWAHKLETGRADDALRFGLSYLTWLVFAGVLVLRAVAGWRGRRAAIGTLTGFVFAAMVLVVYLVRPSTERGPQGRAVEGPSREVAAVLAVEGPGRDVVAVLAVEGPGRDVVAVLARVHGGSAAR